MPVLGMGGPFFVDYFAADKAYLRVSDPEGLLASMRSAALPAQRGSG